MEPITYKCGHHCGTQTIGKQVVTSHCPCVECHGNQDEVKYLGDTDA